MRVPAEELIREAGEALKPLLLKDKSSLTRGERAFVSRCYRYRGQWVKDNIHQKADRKKSEDRFHRRMVYAFLWYKFWYLPVTKGRTQSR